MTAKGPAYPPKDVTGISFLKRGYVSPVSHRSQTQINFLHNRDFELFNECIISQIHDLNAIRKYHGSMAMFKAIVLSLISCCEKH